jgi:hypothetical protein
LILPASRGHVSSKQNTDPAHMTRSRGISIDRRSDARYSDPVESAVESIDTARPLIPLICTGRSDRSRAGFLTRVGAFFVASSCLAVLLAAAHLTPDRAGHGSHTGLGLARCQFIDRTGIPCPSCGMTTSFAWFADGNFPASLYVQPMGFALALLATGTVWAGFYVALTGRAAHRLLRVLPARHCLVSLLVLAIAAWAWKMLICLKGWDGW